MPELKKGSWIVRCKCQIIKDVFVENCTEEQARREPFEFATDEREIDMRDWEVQSVKTND